MKQILVALVSGTVFGGGLALSGMTDPAKVLGFLDVTGDWDPSLALVMASALCVSFAAVRIDARRSPAPAAARIDTKLIVGSVLFGIGWGLAGLCPGPALASLVTGSKGILVFNAAMVTGMMLYSTWDRFAAIRMDRIAQSDG